MADTTYGPKVYRQQGGDRQVVASGGSLDVESGGEIDVESGGSLKLAGTAVTATAAELNALDGITATVAELNILDGVTATFTELNALDGITATVAELNILDGVTATFTELNALDGITATVGELNIMDGVTATAAEINNAADVSARVQAMTVSGAVTAGVQSLELNHTGTIIAATIADASLHQGLFIVKDISATGTIAHTVTITTGTWNGTNKIITLDLLNEAIVIYFDSAGNGTIVENVGTVALSG